MSRHTAWILTVVSLATAGPLLAQVPHDSIPGPLIDLLSAVAALPPAAQIRVSSHRNVLHGRVAGRSPDSLSIVEHTSGERRTIALTQIDTLWIPSRGRGGGVLVGAGIGGLFGVLLASGPDGDDPGLNTVLGVGVFVAGAILGLIADSPIASWTRTYP